MTILRRIRHALFASIAAFLLAILFVPTEEPRTVWSIANGDTNDSPQVVIAAGVASTPLQSPSRLPKLLTARLRWRLMMTQHYADQDIDRQFSNAVEAVDETNETAATVSDAEMTLTSYRQPVEGEDDATTGSDTDTPISEAVALERAAEANDLLSGHQFWTRQHDRASEAYDQLLSLDKPSVVATPVATLPGLPTPRGLLIAVCCGLLGGFTMASLDAMAYRKQRREEVGGDETLHLPASWFHVRRTPLQRLAHGMRTACIAWIVVVVLMLVASARKEMGIQRVTKWPLAELAEMV
ncbi:hypothetical protein Poly24_14960 [Rosistilla carotiformis]|uniref:Transmembrane protein n=1 Tax=Rosistilla carotiformis TaxID=2528017 RepID=A0A518JQH6_9BACT|nr:hypothetical protein [Rosistilla carotiformis]QDV67792.1 hypothetical protein Poly24_14960 [Rosistilla carotiformis]